MKKIIILASAAVALVLATFVGSGFVDAQSFHTGDTVTVKQEKIIDSTVYAAGQTVTIDSEVNGDVICAGQTVKVTGVVHGDVLCAGQTVIVEGMVDGDVRLAGQIVTVSGNIAKNASIAGQSITMSSTSEVKGDVSIVGSDATLEGVIGRDLTIGGETATVGGTVGRDVSTEIANLELASSARIKGNISYTSHNVLAREQGAVVNGDIRQSKPTEYAETQRQDDGFALGGFMYWLLAALFMAMAAALLFPKVLQSTSDRVMPQPWWALLTGFVASIAVPITIITVAITFFGLPLAFLLGLVWLVILLLSMPVFGYYLGRLVLRSTGKPLLYMLAGVAILVVVSVIPVVNVIAFFVTMWIGSGMVLLELFRRTPKPSYRVSETKHKKSDK